MNVIQFVYGFVVLDIAMLVNQFLGFELCVLFAVKYFGSFIG